MVFMQKLKYIHKIPVRAGICNYPEDYYYPSALFYQTGMDNWGFLKHYKGWLDFVAGDALHKTKHNINNVVKASQQKISEKKYIIMQ